jgi:late competence protein required for DNA uptake (superfamily II DNA/RNA helicase)
MSLKRTRDDSCSDSDGESETTEFDKKVAQLQCPHCDDIFDEPVTLTCGHTYCRACVIPQRQCVECAMANVFTSVNVKKDTPRNAILSEMADEVCFVCSKHMTFYPID